MTKKQKEEIEEMEKDEASCDTSVPLGANYILKKDSNCMWIMVKKTGKNGKPWWDRCSGYYQDYEGLYESFARRKLLDTPEDRTATNFIRKMKEVQEETIRIVRALIKDGYSE